MVTSSGASVLACLLAAEIQNLAIMRTSRSVFSARSYTHTHTNVFAETKNAHILLSSKDAVHYGDVL